MKNMITLTEVGDKFFWWQRAKFRDQNECAEHFNVSASFISGVCRGSKKPNQEMLDAIGYKSVSGFVPLEQEDQEWQ